MPGSTPEGRLVYSLNPSLEVPTKDLSKSPDCWVGNPGPRAPACPTGGPSPNQRVPFWARAEAH